MEAAFLEEKKKFSIPKTNNYYCNCETSDLKTGGKRFAVCDVCSENKVLRKTSKKYIHASKFPE